MQLEQLKLDSVTGVVDVEKQVVIIQYIGNVGPEATIEVYKWLARLAQKVDVASARGTVYDFSEVTSFQPGNLHTIKQQSATLNRQLDVSDHPVALIVNNVYQRQIVLGTMQFTPQQNHRKRIVESMNEALSFIDDWHQRKLPAQA